MAAPIYGVRMIEPHTRAPHQHPTMSSSQGFRESNLFGAPIRDLGLKIAGTRLEPVIDEFRAELAQRALRVAPRFHLSTEWGVPFGTVAIAGVAAIAARAATSSPRIDRLIALPPFGWLVRGRSLGAVSRR